MTGNLTKPHRSALLRKVRSTIDSRSQEWDRCDRDWGMLISSSLVAVSSQGGMASAGILLTRIRGPGELLALGRLHVQAPSFEDNHSNGCATKWQSIRFSWLYMIVRNNALHVQTRLAPRPNKPAPSSQIERQSLTKQSLGRVVPIMPNHHRALFSLSRRVGYYERKDTEL